MASWSVSSLKNASAEPFERLAQAPGLPPEFYARHTLEVCRDLLGKILFVNTRSGATWGRIVEAEAYRGDDPASHSSRGETPRCSVMFGEPGVAYVYFIYGMYEMLNFVTEPAGFPGAVLIRAVEPLGGLELMRRRRKAARRPSDLTAGPGKLCRAMGIRMGHNAKSLQGPELRVIDDGVRPANISASARVGISMAQETPWRLFVTANPFVSRVKENLRAEVLR